MLIAVPCLHPDDHPHLERGDASPQGPPEPVAVAQGGHRKDGLRRRLVPQPRLSGSLCQLPTDTVPGQTPPAAGKGQSAQNRGTWEASGA